MTIYNFRPVVGVRPTHVTNRLPIITNQTPIFCIFCKQTNNLHFLPPDHFFLQPSTNILHFLQTNQYSAFFANRPIICIFCHLTSVFFLFFAIKHQYSTFFQTNQYSAFCFHATILKLLQTDQYSTFCSKALIQVLACKVDILSSCVNLCL